MTVVDRFVQAYAHGGLMPKPTLIVVHSAETPLKAGYAASIAKNWFATPQAGTSAHFMIDPAETIRMLSDNVVAYHVGPAANGFTLGIEQAGYARFTRAEWTTPDGLTQIGKIGALIAELAAAHSIPLRWATDDQIRAAAKGVPAGICFHNDIHRVWPASTSHTDPIPNYPLDLLQQAWAPPPPVVAPHTSSAATVLGDDMPTVLQAGDKPPVLAIGGLFVELRTPAEQANALRAYNAGILNADGAPSVDGNGVPVPVWVEPGTLADLIAQSQRAVRGGAPA